MIYRVINESTGETLGIFDASSGLAAYQAMLRDAGYSEKYLLENMYWDKIPDDIAIRAV